MTSNEVREQVESYFRSLNYASSRIMQDVSLIKEGHQEDWDRLSEKEKCEIIWERLVCPRIKEKYGCCPQELNAVDVFPVINLRSGNRMVMDDDTATTGGKSGCWRDEHSTPFSWETQSQLNLRITSPGDETDKVVEPRASKSQESLTSAASRASCNPPTPAERKGRRRAPTPPQGPPPDPPRPRVAPPNPPQVPNAPPEASIPAKPVAQESLKHAPSKPPALQIPKVKVYPPEVPKPSCPAPPPPVAPPRANRVSSSPAKEVSAPEISLASSEAVSCIVTSPSLKEIPKTGFDFLDNW